MSMSKLVLVPTVLLLLSVMAIQQQPALATKWIPFTCDVGGTNCHNDNVISNAPAASSSRADSASAAKSQNNVKCFAFCLGLSTANSGSAADANSRTNSPGDTATVQPVTPRTTTQPDLSVNPNEITPLNDPRNVGTECIDNTGSRADTGYLQGYADGQRDYNANNPYDSSATNNGAHHTMQYQHGYSNGYQAGYADARTGIHKDAC
jgi:hypothetical protein